ncbi:endothelin-1 [Trematomus bernacchii]|uniref:endothelin-1 n=1 Tax=Trematomus bernacchii TaxID=40690 RepID=UPI00146AD5D6|nr:endothelin-1 [Trematomus bernacchii]
MDVYILISVLSMMHSWTFSAVLSAPAAQTPSASTDSQRRHVRTKRCSCDTFMDNECVYFCHLDIIWVNTPERVVSYGLGNNGPRKRRAVAESIATSSGPLRCRCVNQNDDTCRNFCGLENLLRSEASLTESLPAERDACVGPQCEPRLAADTGRITRMRKRNNKKRVSPLAIRSALKTRLLLEKWRVRQHHRGRTWEGESRAS